MRLAEFFNETGLSLLFRARLVAPAILLTIFWLLETWQPFVGQRQRLIHARRNVGFTIINSVILGLTFSSLTVGVAEWTTRSQSGLLNSLVVWPVVKFGLALVLLDGWMYFWHRANHAIPLLWRFHRTHHSDPQMDVTTASRFHIGEHALSNGLRLGVISLFGIELWQLIAYELLVIVSTQFHHANISIGRLDRWIRLIFVTPDMHKVHHSRLKPETDSNYSTVFSIWDRIAGTFRMRPDPESIEFGLDGFDDSKWQTIAGMLKTPFQSPFSAQRVDEDTSDVEET